VHFIQVSLRQTAAFKARSHGVEVEDDNKRLFVDVDFDASVDGTSATTNERKKTVNVLVSSDVRNKNNKMTRLYVRVEQQTL